jgi:hypothetical protein
VLQDPRCLDADRLAHITGALGQKQPTVPDARRRPKLMYIDLNAGNGLNAGAGLRAAHVVWCGVVWCGVVCCCRCWCEAADRVAQGPAPTGGAGQAAERGGCQRLGYLDFEFSLGVMAESEATVALLC